MRGQKILLALFILCLCAGCGGKEREEGNTGLNQTAVSGGSAGQAVSSSAVSGSGTAAESELMAKSREYAEQIAAGLMTPVCEDFTTDMANQLPEENLRASWNSVAGGLTGYQGVESVTESRNGEYSIVLVSMRYGENQGRTIKFVYDQDGHIAGIWFDVVVLQEPAEEKTDTAWQEKEITVGREPYVLKGKLVLPSGSEKVPIVILLSDEDDSDMDGTIGSAANTPLRDLAYGLAGQKIATLRYNRRACQYASALPEDAGLYDTLLQDVWYAVDQMYNNKEIDSSRIYIAAMGKSADYLPAIVAKKSKRLSGAVMLGAKPVRFAETFYAEEAKTVMSDASYFMEKNSTFPLLVLQGEADFETPMTHFEQWKTLWKGRSHVTYHSYEKLNHYFLTTTGRADKTDYDTKGTVNQAVIKNIAKWCQGQRNGAN